jgi:bifunctional non-homologous end joining protein LigD
MEEESITLHCTEGNSDKIYEIHLLKKDDGFILTAANGRRGSTLVPQPKITTPVNYAKAKAEFNKLRDSKERKHYRPIAHRVGGSNSSSNADNLPVAIKTNGNTGEEETQDECMFSGIFPDGVPQRKDTGIRCQLLNEADEALLEKLLDDDSYGMQEKIDGRRLPAGKEKGRVVACNREGYEAGIPENIVKVLRKLRSDHVLDNEAVADTLHSFDLLKHDGLCMRAKTYLQRHELLRQVVKEAGIQDLIQMPTLFIGKENKRKAFLELKTRNAEGVVFKKLAATITWGKSHQDQWKFKFVEMASCITTRKNPTKRSIQIELLRDGKPVNAGNVTVPANMDIPEPGEIVEVRYLYAIRKSGVLYQPVLLAIRDDIPVEECTTDQLKYKPEAQAAGV